jgi:hypothetical protein
MFYQRSKLNIIKLNYINYYFIYSLIMYNKQNAIKVDIKLN